MGAFGDNLRRERELRGISLAEISESTKISKRWLQALEDEEFDVLPGGVFNRGFVRAYAHFLGINEEETIADYIAATNEQPPPENQFPLEIHEKPGSPPLNPKRSLVPVVLATMALVVVVSSWAFWVKHRSVAVQRSSNSALLPVSMPAAPTSSAASPSQADNHATAVQTPQVATAALGVEDISPDKSNARTPKVATSEAKIRPSSIRQTQDAARAFNVVIKARQDSWISISADGRMLWEGTLSENDERAVKADKELVLKTGNAAGIEVSYNGKMLGTLGKDKQVRTLTFNTAGLQQ
jgi:cytoskeleton protein RodZ